jgi:hypothetical protein
MDSCTSGSESLAGKTHEQITNQPEMNVRRCSNRTTGPVTGWNLQLLYVCENAGTLHNKTLPLHPNMHMHNHKETRNNSVHPTNLSVWACGD